MHSACAAGTPSMRRWPTMAEVGDSQRESWAVFYGNPKGDSCNFKAFYVEREAWDYAKAMGTTPTPILWTLKNGHDPSSGSR